MKWIYKFTYAVQYIFHIQEFKHIFINEYSLTRYFHNSSKEVTICRYPPLKNKNITVLSGFVSIFSIRKHIPQKEILNRLNVLQCCMHFSISVHFWNPRFTRKIDFVKTTFPLFFSSSTSVTVIWKGDDCSLAALILPNWIFYFYLFFFLVVFFRIIDNFSSFQIFFTFAIFLQFIYLIKVFLRNFCNNNI